MSGGSPGLKKGKKPDEPGWFRQNKMKVGLPTFMIKKMILLNI
jgi:hypothetical protein